MSLIEDRLICLESLRLESGVHDPPANSLVHACVMEAVAYVVGEPWSDHPECASPVIGVFLRSWNDSLGNEDRQALKPLIARLVDTNAGTQVEEKRAWMAADWLARECAPALLRLAGLTHHAVALEGLGSLTAPRRAEAALPKLAAARAAARAAAWRSARDAARDAAWAAEWEAGRETGRDAAWSAARATTWVAARAAVWAIARGLVRDAARDTAWAAARQAAKDAAKDAACAARERSPMPVIFVAEREWRPSWEVLREPV
jgi:hypothetical protein